MHARIPSDYQYRAFGSFFKKGTANQVFRFTNFEWVLSTTTIEEIKQEFQARKKARKQRRE
tara:strand:+ start:577 stop:759 length:183 start_codon:yes stop_codon:yes gene_type:complete